MSNPSDDSEKSPELLQFEEAARRLGHPESTIDPKTDCLHKQWNRRDRYCPCGALMIDWCD